MERRHGPQQRYIASDLSRLASNLDPTSTLFGSITNNSTTATRFVMLIDRIQF